MTEKIKISQPHMVSETGIYIRRILRYLGYGGMGRSLRSAPHSIIDFISELNPFNISSQNKPEVGSQNGK